jgi:hypothetical protein
MWLLADLFQDLPEEGDVDKPKLVFFFDEAHLLFDDASKGFLDQVEQVVRLIRSKGVGVWFVTQSPKDVPADVLGQLGNRVQHALRAFTPRRRAQAGHRDLPAHRLRRGAADEPRHQRTVTVLSDGGADAGGLTRIELNSLMDPPLRRRRDTTRRRSDKYADVLIVRARDADEAPTVVAPERLRPHCYTHVKRQSARRASSSR